MIEKLEKNIFSQLKMEHQRINDLFKNIKESKEIERKSILKELEDELVSHTRAEEISLYKKLKDKSQEYMRQDVYEVSCESLEEHRIIDILLHDLKSIKVSNKVWMTQLNRLKYSVELHIDEEEEELFTFAKELLSKEELCDVYQDFLNYKKESRKSLTSQEKVFQSNVHKDTNRKAS